METKKRLEMLRKEPELTTKDGKLKNSEASGLSLEKKVGQRQIEDQEYWLRILEIIYQNMQSRHVLRATCNIGLCVW